MTIEHDKTWYKDGKLHREDGPAVELKNGLKEWYKDGQFQILDTVREPAEATQWVPANRLIAAYYLADIDLDSMFLTISK